MTPEPNSKIRPSVAAVLPGETAFAEYPTVLPIYDGMSRHTCQYAIVVSGALEGSGAACRSESGSLPDGKCGRRSPKKLSIGIAATVAGSTHSTTPTRRTLLKFCFGVWRNNSVQGATLLSGSMTRQALSITPIRHYSRLITVWTRPSAHCCFTLSDR